MTDLSTEDFTFVADLLRTRSAISLAPGKEYLIESRLGPLARAIGYADLGALIGELRRPLPDPAIRDQVIEAMTTNETSFFRDRHPFDAMRDHLVDEALERNAAVRRLSVWSAASSTGQELYSIAMLLDDHFPQLQQWKVDLLGTDLSSDVVARAGTGLYSPLEVNRGLPAPMLVKYFEKHGASYLIDERVRRWCRFLRLNLVESWPNIPIFDFVFCRNVLIYFEEPVKKQIIERLRQHVRPGGYLILGMSEGLAGAGGFTPVRLGNMTIYRVEA